MAGYIKEKRGLRELMAGFFRAMDAKNARDDAVVRADIKQKYGTKVLDKVMPRDRRKKALGARPQPKAAKALNVPATKLRAHLSGNKDLSATHKRLADYEAVKGVKAIGDYLCGNREFVRLKACVEVFLKTADPDRFDPSKKTSLAYSAKRDLPSRFFYRDFKDDLAKNLR